MSEQNLSNQYPEQFTVSGSTLFTRMIDGVTHGGPTSRHGHHRWSSSADLTCCYGLNQTHFSVANEWDLNGEGEAITLWLLNRNLRTPTEYGLMVYVGSPIDHGSGLDDTDVRNELVRVSGIRPDRYNGPQEPPPLIAYLAHNDDFTRTKPWMAMLPQSAAEWRNFDFRVLYELPFKQEIIRYLNYQPIDVKRKILIVQSWWGGYFSFIYASELHDFYDRFWEELKHSGISPEYNRKPTTYPLEHTPVRKLFRQVLSTTVDGSYRYPLLMACTRLQHVFGFAAVVRTQDGKKWHQPLADEVAKHGWFSELILPFATTRITSRFPDDEHRANGIRAYQGRVAVLKGAGIALDEIGQSYWQRAFALDQELRLYGESLPGVVSHFLPNLHFFRNTNDTQALRESLFTLQDRLAFGVYGAEFDEDPRGESHKVLGGSMGANFIKRVLAETSDAGIYVPKRRFLRR